MGVENVNNAAMSYQAQGSSVSQSASAQTSQDSTSSAANVVEPQNIEISETARGGESKESKNGQATSEQIKKAVERINKNANGSEAIFGIHDETNRVTIKIVDKKTKEVIKEFPAEETLDMIAKVWEMAGMMVDEKR